MALWVLYFEPFGIAVPLMTSHTQLDAEMICCVKMHPQILFDWNIYINFSVDQRHASIEHHGIVNECEISVLLAEILVKVKGSTSQKKAKWLHP